LVLLAVVFGWTEVALADEPPLQDQTNVAVVPAESDAMDQARATGAPVEIASALDATTAVFALPDGTEQVELSPIPVRVPDSSSASGWTATDTTLVQDSSGVHPAVSAVPITFPDGGVDGFLAKLGLDQDQATLAWLGALPAPQLSGDTATYVNAMPGIDMVLAARPMGFELSFVVKQRPTGPITLDVPLALKGVRAQLAADGSTELVDSATGDIVGQADRARMWGTDWNVDADEPAHQALVHTALVTTPGGGQALELTPSDAFLQDPAVDYPVTIDPTTLTATADTYVMNSSPNSTFSTDTELKLGTWDSGTDVARTLMRWDFSPLAYGTILNGSLKLYETWDSSCSARSVQVFNLDHPATTSATWNNQPSTLSMWAQKSVAFGYAPNGTHPCTESSTVSSYPQWLTLTTGGDNGNSVAALLQAWANQGGAGNGLELRTADETSSYTWKKFSSYNAGSNVPVLSATIKVLPNAPTGMSPASGAIFDAHSTTLSAVYQDPNPSDWQGNPSTGHVEYSLFSNSACTTQISTLSGPTVATGLLSNVTATVSSNQDVWWYVRGVNSIGATGASTCRKLTFQTAAVTISSPAASTWAPSDQSTTVSWTATGGASPLSYYVVADTSPNTDPVASTPSVVITASTSRAFPSLPAGQAYVHVRALDATGVWGATTTLPLFTAPSAGINTWVSAVPTAAGLTRVVWVASGSVLLEGASLPPGGELELDDNQGSLLDDTYAADDGTTAGGVVAPSAGWLPVTLTGASSSPATWRLDGVPAPSSVTATVGGSGVTVNIASPGAEGDVLFTTSGAGEINVALASSTLTDASIDVVDASGVAVADPAPFSTNPQNANVLVPAAGTYRARVTAVGAGLGSVVVSVGTPLSTSTAAASFGSQVSVSVGVGRVGRVYSLTAGTTVVVVLNSATANVESAVEDAEGTQLGPLDTAPDTFEATVDTDTFTVWTDTSDDQTGTATYTAYVVPAPATVALPLSGSASLSLGTPGQTGSFTITATSRTHLTVSISQTTLSGTAAFELSDAAGNVLVQQSAVPLTVGVLYQDLPIPAPGTYSLSVIPDVPSTGLLSVAVTGLPVPALSTTAASVTTEAATPQTIAIPSSPTSTPLTVDVDKPVSAIIARDAVGNIVYQSPGPVQPGTGVSFAASNVASIEADGTSASNLTVSVARGDAALMASALDQATLPGDPTPLLAHGSDSIVAQASDGTRIADDGGGGITLSSNPASPIIMTAGSDSAAIGIPTTADATAAASIGDGTVAWPATTAAASVVGAQVFRDAAGTTGGRVFVTMKSAAAPTAYSLPVSTSADGGVEPLSDGSYALFGADGQMVGVARALGAVDHAGHIYATTLASATGGLSLSVNASGASYPLTAVVQLARTASLLGDDVTPSYTGLLGMYAPKLILDSDSGHQERWRPMLVSDFLPEAWYEKGSTKVHATLAPSTDPNVSQSGAPSVGARLELSQCPVDVVAQSTCEKHAKATHGVSGVEPAPSGDWAYTYERAREVGSLLYLQYWFFYYSDGWFNKDPALGFLAFIQGHQGDWEGYTVQLAPAVGGGWAPIQVSFSQHKHGTVYPWNSSALEKSSGTHVVIHIASGSHANYPTGGAKNLGNINSSQWFHRTYCTKNPPIVGPKFCVGGGLVDYASHHGRAGYTFKQFGRITNYLGEVSLSDTDNIVTYLGYWGRNEHRGACGYTKADGWHCEAPGRWTGPSALVSHDYFSDPSSPFPSNSAWIHGS
jgi:hypothetical protein